MKALAKLYYRVRMPDGSYPYLKPAATANGRLRQGYALIAGKPALLPGGTYYLRVTIDGKRTWEPVGDDPVVAMAALQRRVHELQGQALGLAPMMKPVEAAPVVEEEPEEEKPKHGHLLKESITTYLQETELHKSPATLRCYTETLKGFIQVCREKWLEDISREHVLSYATWLKKRGNAPRTVRNRIDYVQIFLHHFGLPSVLKGKDLPKYTQKAVRAYGEVELGRMLGFANKDEHDLLFFLLCTGAREKEAQFACWSDVDFEGKTFTVREKLDLNFRPKDREEGTLPIPDELVELLKARRKRYPTGRLIFPGKDGKPNGHILRIVKALALKAGVNCGQCVSKGGKSCSTRPICKHVILHKFRKTFASRLHKSGVAARTLMRFLRHSDLETTLRYLADEDNEAVRPNIQAAFSPFSSIGGGR